MNATTTTPTTPAKNDRRPRRKANNKVDLEIKAHLKCHETLKVWLDSLLTETPNQETAAKK